MTHRDPKAARDATAAPGSSRRRLPWLSAVLGVALAGFGAAITFQPFRLDARPAR